MHPRDSLPAILLLLPALVGLAALRLAPEGTGAVLVNLARAGAEEGPPDAALIALPAPGLAVLRGDAARIRAAFGPALSWADPSLQGTAPCSPIP